MLSPANRDLVGRDPQVPGLRVLLDPGAFLDRLASASQRVDLHSVRLHYVRYKPGQSCLAAFVAKTADAELHCFANAYRQGDTPKHRKALQRARLAGSVQNGTAPPQLLGLRNERFYFSDICTEVAFFPNDSELESLPLFADAVLRKATLRRKFPEIPELWDSELCQLAYKPERRWVALLKSQNVPRAVCKLYSEGTFEAAAQRVRLFHDCEVLRFAPIVARWRYRRALFLGWEPGELLTRHLAAPGFDENPFLLAGFALGELHVQEVQSLPAPPHVPEGPALKSLADLMGFLLPSLASRVAEATKRTSDNLAGLPRQAIPIHGDFDARQVLVHGGRATFLDLDRATKGSPLTDLGSFLAHLERETLLNRITPDRRDRAGEALIAGYRKACKEPEMDGLEAHLSARLLARLPDFFRAAEPNWPAQTESMLSQIEALLDRSHPILPRRELQILNRAGGSELSMAEQRLQSAMARAVDPEWMRELVPFFRVLKPETFSVDRVRAVVKRHKPGRRCVVEYSARVVSRNGETGVVGILGKIRARGINLHNYEALKTLSEGDFAPNSPDGISIPKPLGLVRELGMWLQAKVVAQNASDGLHRESGPDVARRLADAICKLHRCRLTLRRTHTVHDELSILSESLGKAAKLHPEWAVRIEAVQAGCARLADSMDQVKPVCIHRDFYQDQALVSEDRVWLVDLDLLCEGDPAVDAGNFLGHLIEWQVRRPGYRAALQAAGKAFRERFLGLSGTHRARDVDAYTTLTLARHIYLSTQFRDRAAFTETILGLCVERLKPHQARAPETNGCLCEVI